jgi:hypothetical protein
LSTSPNSAVITASSKSPLSMLPVRENAMAPARVVDSPTPGDVAVRRFLGFTGREVAFLVAIERHHDLIGHGHQARSISSTRTPVA